MPADVTWTRRADARLRRLGRRPGRPRDRRRPSTRREAGLSGLAPAVPSVLAKVVGRPERAPPGGPRAPRRPGGESVLAAAPNPAQSTRWVRSIAAAARTGPQPAPPATPCRPGAG